MSTKEQTAPEWDWPKTYTDIKGNTVQVFKLPPHTEKVFESTGKLKDFLGDWDLRLVITESEVVGSHYILIGPEGDYRSKPVQGQYLLKLDNQSTISVLSPEELHKSYDPLPTRSECEKAPADSKPSDYESVLTKRRVYADKATGKFCLAAQLLSSGFKDHTVSMKYAFGLNLYIGIKSSDSTGPVRFAKSYYIEDLENGESYSVDPEYFLYRVPDTGSWGFESPEDFMAKHHLTDIGSSLVEEPERHLIDTLGDGDKIISQLQDSKLVRSSPADSACGFQKFDETKPDYSLIPPEATKALAEVMTHGAKKYARDNWKLCGDTNRYIAAMMRHLEAHRSGELIDNDSGMLHMAHVLTNAAFMTYFLNHKENDNE